MCTLYTYANTCMPRFEPSGFFRLSRCLVLTPGLTSEYPVSSVTVCVCVYTQIHPHKLPPASKKKEDTDNTPISPSVKNNPLCPATSALHRLTDPVHLRPPTTINKLCIHARMCIPCSECVRKCVCWCQTTPVWRTHLHVHWRLGYLYHARHTHYKHCRYTLVCTPMQLCSNHVVMETIASYVESCANIMQVAGCRTPTCCPGALSPMTARSRRQSKSTLGSRRGCGCVVAQASSDHSRWCGPHPAGLCFSYSRPDWHRHWLHLVSMCCISCCS